MGNKIFVGVEVAISKLWPIVRLAVPWGTFAFPPSIRAAAFSSNFFSHLNSNFTSCPALGLLVIKLDQVRRGSSVRLIAKSDQLLNRLCGKRPKGLSGCSCLRSSHARRSSFSFGCHTLPVKALSKLSAAPAPEEALMLPATTGSNCASSS